MSSYAVLGATGNVGQSLLQILGQNPERKINAFVRSKAKLVHAVKDIPCDLDSINIFEGNLEDVKVLSECLSNTKAAFLAVAVTDNVPGCTVAQDTAHSVVTALQDLRRENPGARLPRLVILSSASLNHKFFSGIAHYLHSAMLAAASNVYQDLAKAEEYLRSQEDWLECTFVKPGGLVHDAQKGHALSTERQQTFLSFLDLAAGMVEIADCESEKWNMADVSVVPTANDVKIEWWVPVYILKGWIIHFFPWTYPYLKS